MSNVVYLTDRKPKFDPRAALAPTNRDEWGNSVRRLWPSAKVRRSGSLVKARLSGTHEIVAEWHDDGGGYVLLQNM